MLIMIDIIGEVFYKVSPRVEFGYAEQLSWAKELLKFLNVGSRLHRECPIIVLIQNWVHHHRNSVKCKKQSERAQACEIHL